jgi:hypothetical protein
MILSMSFVFFGSTVTLFESNAKEIEGDPSACWALADFVENWANNGQGAQYNTFAIWDDVYNSCLNDFQ